MKKVLAVLFFCFLSNCNFGGCTLPMFITDIGILSDYSGHGAFKLYIYPKDSFSLRVDRGSCGHLVYARVSFNGKTIGVYDGKTDSRLFVKLPCIAGVYSISATNDSYPTTTANWTIRFIEKPKIIDTTAIESETVTSIPIKTLNPDFLFYPSPADHEITLLNEIDEIRSVSFYDLAGKLISSHQVNATKAKIPLDKCPPGFYIMHVSTLSDKIIIKKISVL